MNKLPLLPALLGALSLATLATACEPPIDRTANGEFMRAGQNCLSCHADGFGEEAPPWSAAGTVYASDDADALDGLEGVKVTITDESGETRETTTNAVGNFWIPDGLTAPFDVTLSYEGRTVSMPFAAPAGSCNACHAHPDPVGNASGRITAP